MRSRPFFRSAISYISRFQVSLCHASGFTITRSASSSNTLIDKSEPFHFLWVKQVAAIEHDRVSHRFSRAIQVELFELVPFRGDDERVTTFGDRIHVVDEGGIRKQLLSLVHRLGIMHAEHGAFFSQALAKINGWRHADV